MIRCDSRKVEYGDTFIALKGIKEDGHDYILDAIKNGATKIIAEKGNYSVDTKIVCDTNLYLSNYLKDKYYDKISGVVLFNFSSYSKLINPNVPI